MPLFSEQTAQLFERRGANVLASINLEYDKLASRRLEYVEFGDPSLITETVRARANIEVIQQALLHRAERLIYSASTMLEQHNIYGLSLLIRGHYECTSVLGYLCNRLHSFSAGTIDFDALIVNVADIAVGAKHKQFAQARDPIGIMTCIDKADHFLEKVMFDGKKEGMIRDCYEWLSEFAHPNFLSNSSSLALDKQLNRFQFRHGGPLSELEAGTLGYLDISAKLFIDFFDRLGTLKDEALDPAHPDPPIERSGPPNADHNS